MLFEILNKFNIRCSKVRVGVISKLKDQTASIFVSRAKIVSRIYVGKSKLDVIIENLKVIASYDMMRIPFAYVFQK